MAIIKRLEMFAPLFKTITKKSFFNQSAHKNQFLFTKLLDNNIRQFHTVSQPFRKNSRSRYEESRNRINRLSETIDFNPKNTQALLERASHYITMNNYKNARKDLETAIEIDSQIENLHEIYIRLYLISIDEDPQGAVQMLQKATDIVLKNPKVVETKTFRYICALNINCKEWEKAIQVATVGIECCKSQPDYEAMLLAIRGSTLISHSNQLENGKKDFDCALELNVSSSTKLQLFTFIVETFMDTENDELLDFYVELTLEEEKRIRITTKTDLKSLKLKLKDYYFQKGEYAKTRKIMNDYVNTSSINYSEYGEYQYLCLILGDFHSYMANLNSLYRHTKYNPTIQIELHPPEMDNTHDHLIRHFGCVGLLSTQAGRLETAQEVAEKMKKLLNDYKFEYPTNPMPKKNFETIYHFLISLCNLDNEEVLNENAMKAAESYPKVYEIIGRKYYERENFPKSREYFTKYYNATGDLSALCEVSAFFIDEKEYEKAIREAEKVLEIDPVNYHALYNIGESLFHLGNLEKAREYFDRVMVETEKQIHPYGDLFTDSLKSLWPEYFRNN